MKDHSVAVLGAYHTPIRGEVQDLKLEEMILEASRGALADADITIDDVDAIVIATADQAHGRVIESMVTAGAAGAVGRDLTTVASAGEHALVYAYLRILAGQGTRVLSICWGKPSEANDPRQVELVGAEPFLLRPLGMSSHVAAGLQASAYAARFGVTDDWVESVREARTQAAMLAHGISAEFSDEADEIVAWPLTAADLPRTCDVAAAAVLVAGEEVPLNHPAAWISGVGWASSRYDLGSRDLSQFSSLHTAAERAWGESNKRTVEVVEVQEISTIGGFAACEAIGLADPGKGPTVATGSTPQINPSGGNLPANPGNAAGYMRLLAAAQQVRGLAGATQIKPLPHSALGATLHGYAGQGAVVVRFGHEREVT